LDEDWYLVTDRAGGSIVAGPSSFGDMKAAYERIKTHPGGRDLSLLSAVGLELRQRRRARRQAEREAARREMEQGE
jgi:hypothetical protein